MDDPLLVRGFERLGDLCGHRQRVGQRDRAARDPLGQVLALDEFHDQRRDTVGFFGAVDRGDVWMIQRGQQASLAVEARAPPGIDAEDLGQNLDRDVAAELRVVGAIDLPHPAGAQELNDPIRTDRRPRFEPRRRRAERRLAKSPGLVMRIQQLADCEPKRMVVATCTVDKRITLPGLMGQGVLEDSGDLPPPFGRHARGASVNRVYSRTRATCHQRSTVALELLAASAVSPDRESAR